jgi:IclR family acetate operon transcriptional repressor
VEKVDGRYQLRAVTRALDLLLAMADPPAPYELSTIARHVHLHPATALRHLESLRSRGFVRQLPNGNYELGARLFELGNAFAGAISIWRYANELAQELAASANETASVGILEDGQVLYIAIANGQRELGIQSSPGTRHPAYCTALGKALLASLPWSAVQLILARHPPVRLTDHTLVDPGDLREELERTTARGYSIDDEERHEGVFCIGAAIRDHTGSAVAAVSISGPKFRTTASGIDQLAQFVVDAASQTSRRLGGLGFSALEGEA